MRHILALPIRADGPGASWEDGSPRAQRPRSPWRQRFAAARARVGDIGTFEFAAGQGTAYLA